MEHRRTITLAGGLTGVETVPAERDDGRPPVLMVHGMMGGAWQFAGLQRALAGAGHRTLALNYRGHHGSRPVPALARVGVRDYARDALAGCEHLGGRPVVVGQSMGGLVALLLAEAGAVAAAVLVCSLPPRGVLWRTRHPAYTLRPLVDAVRGRPLRPRRADLGDLVLNGLDGDARELAFRRQVPESSRAFLQIAAGGIAVDRRLVTCPVLSVSAGRDALVTPGVGRRLAARYRADHLHLHHAAHYALVCEPAAPALHRAIAGWIDSLSTVPDGA